MSRSELIETYRRGPERVRQAWQAVPEEARRFRPAPGEWSPHEIVVHLADGDVNGYVRFRKLVAEPGSLVTGYAQPDWAAGLDYLSQEPERALELMALLRSITHPILAALPEATWGNTVEHAERGTWSMDDWLLTYTRHVDAHLQQMEEAVEAWRMSEQSAASH